jgi:hypothetical protein
MPEITEEEYQDLKNAKARSDLQAKVMKKLNASFTFEERSKRNKRAWKTRKLCSKT